jgi:(p)ppGpp synthase/HD superfamily hydrolase
MKDIEKYIIINYKEVRDWASEQHARLGLLYDNMPYLFHLDMVAKNVILFNEDPELVAAAYCHDILEDTDIKYFELNKVLTKMGFPNTAEIVYNVTNETGRNRNEKTIKTLPKIISTEKSIFLKLCDRLANIKYSKSKNGSSSMFNKYRLEHNLLLGACSMYKYDTIDYISIILKNIEQCFSETEK